jgi:mono/diheme cytochrome c family protein
MTKYNVIRLLSLLVLVAALPVYAFFETARMQGAQVAMRQGYLADGAEMYVENCVRCHGVGGEGIGAMPTLNNPALAGADGELLYRTIAHSPHGTIMAAWHVDEGGILSDYQVEGLVAIIQDADWGRVGRLAAVRGVVNPTPEPAEPISIAALYGPTSSRGDNLPTRIDPSVEAALMSDMMAAGDPHECSACHEEPTVHADRFGLQCARCHGLVSWKPALLTRHTFLLDHGDEGPVACQTCHIENYVTHTCYECHDHQPDEMDQVHRDEGILEVENCIECHPTGREGEANRLRGSQASRPDDSGGADSVANSDFRQFLNSLVRQPGPAGAGDN